MFGLVIGDAARRALGLLDGVAVCTLRCEGDLAEGLRLVCISLLDGDAGLRRHRDAISGGNGEGELIVLRPLAAIEDLLNLDLALALRGVGIGNGQTILKRRTVLNHRGLELARGAVSLNHYLYRILSICIGNAILLDPLSCGIIIFWDNLFDGVVIRSGRLKGDRSEDSWACCARGARILSATCWHGSRHAGIIRSSCEREVEGCHALRPHVDRLVDFGRGFHVLVIVRDGRNHRRVTGLAGFDGHRHRIGYRRRIARGG